MSRRNRYFYDTKIIVVWIFIIYLGYRYDPQGFQNSTTSVLDNMYSIYHYFATLLLPPDVI